MKDQSRLLVQFLLLLFANRTTGQYECESAVSILIWWLKMCKSPSIAIVLVRPMRTNLRSIERRFGCVDLLQSYLTQRNEVSLITARAQTSW
jgi:hypothetical protein